MVGEIHFAREESEDERAIRLEMLRDAEQAAANAAVRDALATYRWWGWTAIVCKVRMFITGIRLRLGMKLWP